MQKQALSLLIRLFLHYFSHRMDIRCFLTGFFGQEDEPSELLQFPRYCSGADKAANDRAGYIPHRDPLKPARGSALMCAQVINLAVGDSCCALHGARAGPNEDHTLPSHTRELFGNCEQ